MADQSSINDWIDRGAVIVAAFGQALDGVTPGLGKVACAHFTAPFQDRRCEYFPYDDAHGPVSYTHLDVYKRQLYYCAE